LNAISSNAGSFRRPALLLVLAVLIFSLPQAALVPLLDRDEPRFAEASREMLQSGNYIVPTFNQAPRYAKPPLIYWCQALSFSLFGENAFAARLPSLLAVAGTALVLLAWGTELGSSTAGMIAGLAYALCLQTMQQGRVATADALLIFFMTLTGYAGWRLLALARAPETGSWNFWGIVLALGFGGGFLAKGPEALLPFIPLVIAARSSGGRVLGAFIALLALGLLLVAAWAIPAYIQTHGDYWREGLGHDVGDRMVTGFQGHGASTIGWYLLSLPFYLLLFWIGALPWSPLLVTQRRRLFADRAFDETDRYLLWNAGLIFAVFSLIVTKLPHYTLPAFPFLALFFARRWVLAGLNPATPAQLLIRVGMIITLLTLIAVPLALREGRTPSPVGVLVQERKDELHPDTQFALVDFREPNAIWEMRRIVTNPAIFISESDVISYLKQLGPRAVILSTPVWETLKAGADPGWKTCEAHGFNAARYKRFSFVPLDLTLVTKSR
jgi:4-amino-4-deoxy-L-arabinose transferase-like glycosyltransferase